MKKGDRAKLDLGWWKKNKSVRLRSKSFDTAFGDYVAQKELLDRTAGDAEGYGKARDLATRAGSEAKALAGRCGVGQGETKAVLEDFVRLFATEAKEMAREHAAALKHFKAAAKIAGDAEARVEKVSSEVTAMNRQLDLIEAKLDRWIATVGTVKALATCTAYSQQIDRANKGLQQVDGMVNMLEGSVYLQVSAETRQQVQWVQIRRRGVWEHLSRLHNRVSVLERKVQSADAA